MKLKITTLYATLLVSCKVIPALLCFVQLHTVGSKFDIVDMLPLSVWLLTTVQMDKITLFLANYSQHVNSKLKVFKCQLVI